MKRASLEMVPVVSIGTPSARSFPLELGRVDLVTWWLKSCCRRRRPIVLCPPAGTRQTKKVDCTFCHNLITNAKFLSKSMFKIDAYRKLHITGKNSKCMFLNGVAIEKVAKSTSGISLRAGDVISFRSRQESIPWMMFQIRYVQKAPVVTPESIKKRPGTTHVAAAEQTPSVVQAKTKDNECDEEKDVGGVDDNDRAIHHHGGRLRPLVQKRKRTEQSSSPSPREQPRSKRRLFAQGTTKNSVDEVDPSTQPQLHYDPVSCSGETVKQGPIPPLTQYATNSPCSSSVSSILSIPQFSSLEHNKESSALDHVKDLGTQAAAACRQSLVKTTMFPPIENHASRDGRPVSELCHSQWIALQQDETQTKSSVRRALVDIVLATNPKKGEPIMFLPKLLEGAMISSKELYHKSG